jgi:hypothetical protein
MTVDIFTPNPFLKQNQLPVDESVVADPKTVPHLINYKKNYGAESVKP